MHRSTFLPRSWLPLAMMALGACGASSTAPSHLPAPASARATTPAPPAPSATPALTSDAPHASAPVRQAPLRTIEVTLSLAAEVAYASAPGPYPNSVGFRQMGSKVLFQAERQIAELDGGRLVRRPEILRGLPSKGFTPVTFFGTWPTSAWVQLRDDTYWETTGGDHTRGVLYHWDKDRFRRVKPVDVDEQYEPWFPGDGSVGAIVHTMSGESSAESVFTLLDGPSNTPVPRLARRSTGEQRLFVRATASLPSGHVFVLGVEPAPMLREIPMVERFGPREDLGTLEALPLPPDAPPTLEWYDIAARAPDEVYVIGVLADPPEHMGPVVSYLARFDGTHWKMLDVPQGLWAPQIAIDDDGALWILSDTPKFNPTPPVTFTSQLLRRSPTGEWAQIRLRTANGPLGDDVIWSGLFVQGRTLWLVSFQDREGPLSVWTSGPAGPVLKMGL